MIHNPTRYTDLLKDPKFINWQLVPDESLDIYWNNLIKDDPDLENEINKAIKYLKENRFNRNSLTTQEKEALLNKILKTYRLKNNRKNAVRYLKITIAGCVATALLVFCISIFTKSDGTSSEISYEE